MKVIDMNISEIIPYENNPRINGKAVDKVAESIKEFGFQQPIVVDRNNVIIVGHTRYKAAKNLGLNEVPVIVAEKLNEKQAKAYRLADNKTSDFSIWDNKKLLEELDGLDDIFTGFEESEIFDGTLDDINDSGVLDENEYGVTYSVTIKTSDKEKLERILEEYNNAV